MRTNLMVIAAFIGTMLLVSHALALEDSTEIIHDPVSVQTEPGKKEFTATETAGALLLAEGVLAVNAAWAASNPEQYGYVGLLLFPLGAVNGGGSGFGYKQTSFWVTLAGAEAIAIYNINIDKVHTSKNEIFRNNMVAWHGLIAIAAITGYFAGDFDKAKDKKLAFEFLPEPKGGRFLLSYRL